MGMIQQKLREDLPYGQVFQGDGTPDARDAGIKFHQHGLYFKADGSLATESPRNADKIALLKSLERNPEEPLPDPQVKSRQYVNPEIVDALRAKTDEEVYNMAMILTTKLAEMNVEDTYEPMVESRDDNIDFISKHTV